MKFTDMKIGTRLIIGFTTILTFVALLGFVSYYQGVKLWQNTDDMYSHPLQVARAIRDIKAEVLAMKICVRDMLISDSANEIQNRKKEYNDHEINLNENIKIIDHLYLGPKQDIDSIRYSFSKWEATTNEILSKVTNEVNISLLKTMMNGIEGRQFENLLKHIETVQKFSKEKADHFYSNAAKEKRNLFIRLLIILILILLFTIITGYLITRSVREPLKGLTRVAEEFESGNYHARSSYYSKNEIGSLASTFNMMAATVQAEMEIKNSANIISRLMMEQNELHPFCKNLLINLKNTTESQVGAIYLLNENTSMFEHIESIGMDRKNIRAFSADSAEGQFGAVISEKKIQRITEIPADSFFSFPTISGSFLPREIISIPILDENKVIAIISLASIKHLNEISLRWLNEINITMTARFNGVLSYQKIIDFSEKLNSQNRLLEAQSEELQSQTEELQSQTEELQAQSEELRITSEELHEQNARLAAKSIEVEEANRLKSEFLSNMSHELRTPLNSIMALSNVLIQRSHSKLSDEENSYLEIIERNGRNLLKLINDILDLSKIEAGKIDIEVKLTNIGTLVSNIKENIQPLAIKKGLNIAFNSPSDIPAVETDEARLQQILTNLIGNAVKFTEIGAVNINIGCDKSKVWIEIADTGIGIPKSDIKHIFDKFRQVDGSSTRSYEGTGLGLSIVQEMINIIGGEIIVSSEIGVGSVFKVILPIKWKGPVNDIKLTQFSTATVVPDKKTILVVDDDPRIINEISEFLGELGYNIISTSNASEVVKLAEIYRPFVITLDVIMPELDGWEVLQRLKKNIKTQDIAVIMVSVSTDTNTGIALGATGHIIKPVEKVRLMNEIRKLHTDPINIMVVDDNLIDLELITTIINREGINVINATNGSQCIELLKVSLPDILVLDLMMPETDGFQVLNYIRSNEKTKNLPVVVVTAKDLTAEDKHILSGKISSILIKSEMQPKDVLEEIKLLISKLEKINLTQNDHSQTYKKNILIVEDNEDAIIQIKDVLENEGFEVDIALGGEQAIEHVKNKIPDGIVLDLMMPGIDGFEVLENIRNSKVTSEIPVLILSAKDLTKEELGRLSSNNVQQLVQKGAIDIKSLIQKIKAMTGQGQSMIFETSRNINATKQKKHFKKTEKYNILVIEDNPDNMITIKAIVGDDYIIDEANDGNEGLLRIFSERPDLVLLDLSLPKMNGFEVMRKIRENELIMDIPVIAVTARAMKEDKEEIAKAGFDGYISKPIDAVELLEKIKEFLA